MSLAIGDIHFVKRATLRIEDYIILEIKENIY